MPDWISGWIGAFFNLARHVMPGIVGRVLVTFGLSIAVNKFVMPDLIAWLQGHMGAISGQVMTLIAFLNIDKVATMILSALAARSAARAILGPAAGVGGGGGSGS